MLGKIGNKNFSLLSKLLDLHSAKHQTIAQNIAHVNTPNYRRREFKFDKALNRALDNGSENSYQGVRGYVDRPNTRMVRNNGNNVDIDMEMMDLNSNSTLYETYAQLYNRKGNMLKMAIRGAR